MIELIVTIILIVTHNFTVEDTRFSVSDNISDALTS